MKRVIALALAIAFITITAGYLFHMNGNSFDPSGTSVYIIVTDSMEGEQGIQKDTLVFTRGIDDMEIGNIVGYRTSMSDSLFFHRIVNIDGNEVTLKGDAYDHVDVVSKEQIECKIVGEDHTVGSLIVFVRSHAALLITAIILMTGIYSLLRRNNNVRREKEN